MTSEPVVDNISRKRTPASPAVTVVVLNWCGEELTTECLRSLRASDYDSLAVLLVDNGSPDGSGNRLRESFPEVSFLQTGENFGYAGGNNRGIDWALREGADYILILNNDTVLDRECIRQLVAAAENSGEVVGGVVPKILYHDEPDRIWFAGGDFSRFRGLGLHRRDGEPDDPSLDRAVEKVTFMTGCCCLLSERALRSVGRFSEEFFAYVEDAELSLRLTRAGYAMLYQPAARVLHHCPPSGTPPTPFQIRHRDRNRRRVMRKHFGFLGRAPFRLRFVTTRIALLLRYLLTGDLPRARAILHGMTEGFWEP